MFALFVGRKGRAYASVCTSEYVVNTVKQIFVRIGCWMTVCCSSYANGDMQTRQGSSLLRIIGLCLIGKPRSPEGREGRRQDEGSESFTW